MKKNKLDAIGYVDGQLIEKAEKYSSTKKKNTWTKWMAMAACLCLAIAATVVIPNIKDIAGPVGNKTVEEKKLIVEHADYHSYASLSELEKKQITSFMERCCLKVMNGCLFLLRTIVMMNI